MKNLYEYIEDNIDNLSVEDLDELLISVLITLKEKKEDNIKKLYKLYKNNNNLIGSDTYYKELNDYNDFMVMYDSINKYYEFD